MPAGRFGPEPPGSGADNPARGNRTRPFPPASPGGVLAGEMMAYVTGQGTICQGYITYALTKVSYYETSDPMIRMWRLSEGGEDNLGLACTNDGLVLGRTPLIERRDHRFVVRDQGEIEALLSRAYQENIAADRLMPGLAIVAAALNANDSCLARIAAVHLRIPDLPDRSARDQPGGGGHPHQARSCCARRSQSEPGRPEASGLA